MSILIDIIEPPHHKTNIVHMRNKGADQLCSNCTADQHLCFRYMYSTILLLLIFKDSSFYHSSVTVQTGPCRTWSETQIVDFLMRWLIYNFRYDVAETLLKYGAKPDLKNKMAEVFKHLCLFPGLLNSSFSYFNCIIFVNMP